MMCHSNIACCEYAGYFMLKYNILHWYIAFSSYNDPIFRE
jgi:hypothetical protein